MADHRPDEQRVVYDGLHVATLTERRERGPITCRYTDEALERWPGNTPVLSCSLPLGSVPLDATAFLDGLLPEGQARAVIAASRGVVASDTWMLLAHLGRDVPGALSIVPEPSSGLHGAPDVDPYSDADLEAAVAGLAARPLDVHDDSELSLPGLQDKMTLVALDDGRWGRPIGGTPSTHILKVEDRRFPGLADHEAAALRLARHLGLTSIDVEVATIGDLPCLIVSRYDRVRHADGTVTRIHQEDLCQARGYDPTHHRLGKYERHGAPGFLDAAELLRAWGSSREIAQLGRAMVFTVAIGNSDAHAKNLSLLHPEPGRLELAPLYDTVPTVLFDRLPRRCAMTVNGVFEELGDVTFTDLVAEMVGRRRWGVSPDAAETLVTDTLDQLTAAVDELDLPEAFATHLHHRTRDLLAQHP